MHIGSTNFLVVRLCGRRETSADRAIYTQFRFAKPLYAKSSYWYTSACKAALFFKKVYFGITVGQKKQHFGRAV